jgi:pimeloyl-ACP methyl ester carboxylesterase
MISRRSAGLSLLGVLAAAGCGMIADAPAARREAEAARRYPPMGRFVTVAGRRIHLATAGRGPDVVLIHGALGNLRDFTFGLMPRLAGRYRVTAFDRPGLGWSEDLGSEGVSPFAQAAALRAAAAAAGLRRPVVVGQSYGGAVAMAWALAAPAETAAVVSIAGATMPWSGGPGALYSIAGSAFGAATVVPLITALIPERHIEGAVADIFAPEPVPAGYLDHIGAPLALRRATLVANARQINGLKPFLRAMARAYPRLRRPVEAVHGTADRIVPAHVHAAPMVRLLPEGRLVLLDGAGHMPHHTREAAVIGAIDRAAARARLR